MDVPGLLLLLVLRLGFMIVGAHSAHLAEGFVLHNDADDDQHLTSALYPSAQQDDRGHLCFRRPFLGLFTPCPASSWSRNL